MNKQLIIGLAGPKRCGKNTVGQILIELLNHNAVTVAFADPIKHTIQTIFGLTTQELEHIKVLNSIAIIDKDNPQQIFGKLSGRDFVREIGMLMRSYDDQQFNRYVESIIDDNFDKAVIVTDVRFQNEVDLIHKKGGIVINITRSGVSYDNHVTECGIVGADFDLINDDIDQTKDQLKNILAIYNQSL